MRHAVLALVLFASLPLAACGGDDGDYPTFQACFDDHTMVEGFDPTMAITICTLDHSVDGESLEFATVEDCATYVDANLTDTSASITEITAGCEDYIVMKDE